MKYVIAAQYLLNIFQNTELSVCGVTKSNYCTVCVKKDKLHCGSMYIFWPNTRCYCFRFNLVSQKLVFLRNLKCNTVMSCKMNNAHKGVCVKYMCLKVAI